MKIKIKLPDPSSMFESLLNSAKKLGSALMLDFAPALIIVLIGCFAILKGPELHTKWLRAKVGSKVYYVRDQANGPGGTGSAIKAPSGESYILTNDHVCGVSKDGTLLIQSENGDSMRRRIVAHDENSDLCLIEGLPGVSGLSVASSAPSAGDIVAVVGHPHLLPLLLSRGEMMGKEDMQIVQGPISITNPQTGEELPIDPQQGGIAAAQCKFHKNKISEIEVPILFFSIKVKMCIVQVHDAYITSAVILPGNSGSPVVNFWGQVEGVAFASDTDVHWGRVISLDDIQDFVKNY